MRGRPVDPSSTHAAPGTSRRPACSQRAGQHRAVGLRTPTRGTCDVPVAAGANWINALDLDKDGLITNILSFARQ